MSLKRKPRIFKQKIRREKSTSIYFKKETDKRNMKLHKKTHNTEIGTEEIKINLCYKESKTKHDETYLFLGFRRRNLESSLKFFQTFFQ